MPVASVEEVEATTWPSVEEIEAISCPVDRTIRLTVTARRKCTLTPPLALLRRLSLAECRWLLGMSAADIADRTGTPRPQVFTLTRGLESVIKARHLTPATSSANTSLTGVLTA